MQRVLHFNEKHIFSLYKYLFAFKYWLLAVKMLENVEVFFTRLKLAYTTQKNLTEKICSHFCLVCNLTFDHIYKIQC